MRICRKCGNKLNIEDKKCPICKTNSKDAIIIDDGDTTKIEETIASIRANAQNSTPKKKGKGCLIAIGIIIILIIIMALSGGGNKEKNPEVSIDNDTSAEDVQSSAEIQDFEIVGDVTTEFDGFGFYINGTVKNNTNREYSYAQVTFNLYDSSGSQLGSAIDNINNLEAGGSWKFKALGLLSDGQNVSTYKYMGVDAF